MQLISSSLLEAGLITINSLIQGNLWRLFLSAVTNGSIISVLMSGIVIYFVGGQLESLVGHWRVLVIYFLSSLAGLAATAAFAGSSALVTTSDAAILGLFGGFLMLGDAFKENAFFGQIARQYWLFLFLTIGLSLLTSRQAVFELVGGVLGGFLSSMALGAPKVGKINPINRWVSGVVYVLAVIFFAYLGMNR